MKASYFSSFSFDEQDLLTSSDIVWDASKRIITGKLPVIMDKRFSYNNEINGARDEIVDDSAYVILDYDFPANVGMYEVRKDDGVPFESTQGFYLACYDSLGKIVEVVNVNCGIDARMMAIPLTVPMIEKKKIKYIRFAIPKEGNFDSPFITKWGTYTISDKKKKKVYDKLFKEKTIDLSFFKRKENEQSDDGRINAALKLAYWGKTVSIPDGYYSIQQPIKAFYFQNISLGSSAVLSASDDFEGKEYSNSIIEYDCGAARRQPFKGSDRYTMWVPYPDTEEGLFPVERRGIRGGCIDGRGIANCIMINHARGLIIDDISMKNPHNHGLKVLGSQELFISRCTCINTVESKVVNTAFAILSADNMIRDCVAIDTSIGFHFSHYTIASSLHHWIGMIDGKFEGSVSFKVSAGSVLMGCYADTSETCFEILPGGGTSNLIGCVAYSNPDLVNITKLIGIKAGGKVNVLGGNFFLRTSVGYEKNIKNIEGEHNVNLYNVAGLN